MITVRKITRSLTAVMPGWLIAICGVCLAIPLARLAALLLTAGLCLVQPARVRRAACAWNGGKSHRTFDEIPALPPGLLFGGIRQPRGAARCQLRLPAGEQRDKRWGAGLLQGRRRRPPSG